MYTLVDPSLLTRNMSRKSTVGGSQIAAQGQSCEIGQWEKKPTLPYFGVHIQRDALSEAVRKRRWLEHFRNEAQTEGSFVLR